MKKLIWIMLSSMLFTAAAVAEDWHKPRRHNIHNGLEFKALLSSAQEVPANDSRAWGVITAKFDPAFTRVWVDLRAHGLSSPVIGVHFHCQYAGVNGPLGVGLQSPGPFTFDGNGIWGVLKGENFPAESPCTDAIGRPINNVAALALAMRDGLIYLNVHTDMYKGGEIRGQMLEVEKHYW